MSTPRPKPPTTRRRLSLPKRLAFAALTCGLVMGLVEGGWRLAYGWNRSWLDCHRWHKELGWCLREGWAGKYSWTGGYSRINPQGIRDDRPVGPKQPGEKRLLILGDSVTFGAGMRTEQTYPYLLERQLASTNRPWRVLNGGVTAYDPSQEADWLEEFGWPLQPDILAVAFCRNDLCPSNRAEWQDQLPSGSVSRWLAEHSIAYFHLQRSLVRLKHRIVTGNANPAAAPGRSQLIEGWPLVEQSYRRIAARAKDRGVPTVMLIFPTLDTLRGNDDGLTVKLQQLAAELNWSVIDLAPAFGSADESQFLPNDPVHPSAAGYERVAEYLAHGLFKANGPP